MQPMQISSSLYDKEAEYNDRNGFIRKVYGILSVQFLTTAGLITYVKTDQKRNAQIKEFNGLAISAVIVAFMIQISIICCRNVARKVPLNFILLGIFTILEAFAFAFICAFYDANSCIMAASLTAGVTVALTLYAVFTKTDFTVFGQFMCIIFVTSLMLGLLNMVMSVNNIGHTIIAGIFVIIYGLYLIFDTQLIVGDRKYGISMDDYIVGAMIIYMDVMILFLKILEVLGKRD